MEFERLTGSEKAGILLLSLPEESVRDFLDRLEDREVERILSAVARFDTVPPEIQRLVLEEFRNTLGRQEVSVRGGYARAREIASRALDDERASRVMDRLGQDEKRIDWTLRAYSPDFIAETLREEHPQTIALVLSQLPAERGATVIGALEERLRADVVVSLAELESVTTEIIAEVEEGVSELFARPQGAATRVGGADQAAKVLNRVAKEEGSAILDGLDERDPELAGLIRNRMLTFNDLVGVDDRGFQALLREVPTDELVVALKTASDAMKDKIFSNVSKRAADQIREEMDLAGPVRLSEVEEKQQAIVAAARKLEAEGKLSIEAGGSSSDVLV